MPFYLEAVLSLPVFLLIILTDLGRLKPDDRIVVLAALVWALSLFISGFSGLYYHAGLDPGSFNQQVPLTKVDALYVCLGTLTTGASVQPISTGTRLLTMLQMILTLGLVSVVLTIALPRLWGRAS
jgi:hypothetical protein